MSDVYVNTSVSVIWNDISSYISVGVTRNGFVEVLQYTMYLSTARGSSLADNDRTMDVRVLSDRPSTP